MHVCHMSQEKTKDFLKDKFNKLQPKGGTRHSCCRCLSCLSTRTTKITERSISPHEVGSHRTMADTLLEQANTAIFKFT